MNESGLSLIFDLDGTLWNSTPTIYNVWKQELNLTERELDSLMGMTNEKIIETLKISEEKLKKLQEKENKEITKKGGVLFADVLEMIPKLSKKYDLYIVSNCQKGYIEAFLAYYKLEKYFKDFECSGNTLKNKNANLKLLIKRNKICNAIMIGDTKSDLKAAKAANIPFVFASYGFGNLNSEYSIGGIEDLPKMIKVICNSKEYRDLYNGDKIMVFDRIKKGNKIPKNKYYITVVIFIENDDGKLFLQVNKKYNLWSITGGHPKCGESSIEGAKTELKEELNINVNKKELKLFKTIKTDDDFVDLYYLKKNIDLNSIKTQFEEVGEIGWFDLYEIDKLIKDGKFLPDHVCFYNIFIDIYRQCKKTS